MSAGTRRSPGGNRGLDRTSTDTTSITNNGSTRELTLPPALEQRLQVIEARIVEIAACCPLACGSRCTAVCPTAVQP
jgi:hypothetical protein